MKRKRPWIPRGPAVKRLRPAAFEEKELRQKWLGQLRKSLVWDDARKTLWKQRIAIRLRRLGHQAWVNHVADVLPHAYHEIYDVLYRHRPEYAKYADRRDFMERRGEEVLDKFLGIEMTKQRDFERRFLFIMRAFSRGYPFRFKALCPFCNLEDDEKTVTFEARLHHWPNKRRPIFHFRAVRQSPVCTHRLLHPYVQFECFRHAKDGFQFHAIYEFMNPACRRTYTGMGRDWVHPWPCLAFLREICRPRTYNAKKPIPENSLLAMNRDVRVCEKLEELHRDRTSPIFRFSERGLLQLIQEYVRGREDYGKGAGVEGRRKKQGIPKEQWPIP